MGARLSRAEARELIERDLRSQDLVYLYNCDDDDDDDERDAPLGRDVVAAVSSSTFQLWKEETDRDRAAVRIVELMLHARPDAASEIAPDRKVVVKVLRKGQANEQRGFFDFVERRGHSPSTHGVCAQDAVAVRQARDDLLRFVGEERPHAPEAAAASVLAATRDAVPTPLALDGDGVRAALTRLQRGGGALMPRCVRVFESDRAFFLVSKLQPWSLWDLQRAAHESLSQHGTRVFLAFQLLRTLADAHANGLAHGALRPESILVTKHSWLYISELQLRVVPRSLDGASALPTLLLQRWCARELSNFDYLMALNRLAGRRVGSPERHPVLPWVHDLLTDPTAPANASGWRDLTRSKCRLARGDEQLDFSFQNMPFPHHVSEPLSDLTYYHYLARRTPIPILRRFVRSRFVAGEFPSSIQRIVAWSPDECIPEFFTEPTVFQSLHGDMADIAVPPWCASVDEFLAKHRAALEHDRVSANLHRWIDLVFGFRLSGAAAIEAKNVPLRPHVFGFVQLFRLPHPPRLPLPVLGAAQPAHVCASKLALQVDAAAPLAHAAVASPTAKPQRIAQLAAVVESLEPVRRLNQLLRKNRGAARASVDEESFARPDAADAALPLATAVAPLSGGGDAAAAAAAGDGWQSATALDSSLLSHALFRDQALLEHAASLSEAFACLAPRYALRRERSAAPAGSAWSTLAADDVFAAGCIIAELFLGRAVLDAGSIDRPASAISNALERLPSQIARLVAPMLAIDPARRPLAAQVLDSDLFGADLVDTFAMLRDLKTSRSPIARFDVVVDCLPRLSALPLDCFALSLPVLIGLFECNTTRVAALLTLTQPLSDKLGSEAAFKLLRQPLRALFKSSDRAVVEHVLRPKVLACLLDAFGSAAVVDSCLPAILERVRAADERSSAVIVDTLQSLVSLLGVPLSTQHVIAPLAHQLERAADIEHIANATAAFVAVCVELPQNVICQFLGPLTALLRRPEVRDGGDAGADVALCVLSTLNRFVDEFDLSTVLREFVSKSTLFVLLLNPPSQKASLKKIMIALAGTLVHVAVKIGATLTSELIVPYLKQFFAHYDEIYEFGPEQAVLVRESAPRDGVNTYSLDLVALLYVPIRDQIGDAIRHEVGNWELLELLLRQSSRFSRAVPSSRGSAQQRRDPATLRRSIGAALDVADWLCAHVATLDDDDGGGDDDGDDAHASVKSSLAAYRTHDVDRGAVARGERASPWRYRGEIAHTFRAHQNGATACIARSAHERPLLTGGRDSLVKLWSLESHNAAPLQQYQQSGGAVHSAFFVGGSAGYAGADMVASCNAQLHVWSTEKGTRVSAHQHDNAPFVCCALSTRGTHTAHVCVAAAAADGVLMWIDVTQRRPAMLWALPKLLGVPRSIVASDDGAWVAVGGTAGNAAILDQRTGIIRCLWRACESGVVTGMSVTRDGRLATASTDGQLQLWSVPECVLSERTLPLGGEPLTCMAEAGDALWFVGGQSGRVAGARLDEAGGFRCGALTLVQRSAVASISCLPLHRVVVCGFDDGAVRCIV
jgi:serine/threonine protein kinase